jgi:AraC-like DNA-binding protein
MREQELYAGRLVTIVDFDCPPGDAAWRWTNAIGSPVPIVVFPSCTVGVRRGGRYILATPNLAMLYNPMQEFERELRDPVGDRCVYFRLHPPALDELERLTTLLANRRLSATHAPTPRGAFLAQHLLARSLREGGADPLAVEEQAAHVIAAVLADRPSVRGRRRATRAAHVELAEAAKELIVASIAETRTLDELAATLGVSPFHLARVFRAETGFSIHQWRKQLRLRTALERLREGASSLTSLAFELGFASHSHFTDAFRAEFGCAPSALRAA